MAESLYNDIVLPSRHIWQNNLILFFCTYGAPSKNQKIEDNYATNRFHSESPKFNTIRALWWKTINSLLWSLVVLGLIR